MCEKTVSISKNEMHQKSRISPEKAIKTGEKRGKMTKNERKS